MIVVVAFNFRAVDRDHQFLMPPSMAEWLPEDHLAWFVIDVAEQLAGLGSTSSAGSTSGRIGERVSLVARRYVSVGKVKLQMTDGESMQLIYGDEIDTAGSAPDNRIKVRYRGRGRCRGRVPGNPRPVGVIRFLAHAGRLARLRYSSSVSGGYLRNELSIDGRNKQSSCGRSLFRWACIQLAVGSALLRTSGSWS